ncbi:Uncharacterised protein [Vibrio cholerae]|nr:Uncharacterised protein [Vibrio cholerae]
MLLSSCSSHANADRYYSTAEVLEHVTLKHLFKFC